MVLLLASGSPAAAERLEHRGSQDDQAACTPDVFRLCSNFIPSEPQIVACLIRSRLQLSPACRKVFSAPPPRAARATPAPRRAAPRRTTTRATRPAATRKAPARTTQRPKASGAKSPG